MQRSLAMSHTRTVLSAAALINCAEKLESEGGGRRREEGGGRREEGGGREEGGRREEGSREGALIERTEENEKREKVPERGE